MTDPHVTGPVVGKPANAMPATLAEHFGYLEAEYFISGHAASYTTDGEMREDGRWSVSPTGTAPYTTRVLVRRPADTSRFDGTVIVEWLNVSSGVDGDPDFGLLHPVLLAAGHAYLGVTAQQVAVGDGGHALLDLDAPAGLLTPLKRRDPERYGDLSHPGDAYSYDIFAQVALAIGSGGLLADLEPTNVIAIGESQSAYRLTSFVNAIQPRTHAYDGFLLHSRAAAGAALGDEETDPKSGPPVHVRNDLDVPVLQFETETDLLLLRFLPARQPDTDLLVTWEVAGTAHADASLLEYGRLANPSSAFDLASICGSINEGPQAEVLRAAFAALVAWVCEATAPPRALRLEAVDGALVRDDDGIVLGGVRTPAVDAPVSTLTGESTADEPLCRLFGATVPFSADRIGELYADHDVYVAAVSASADEAVANGFLLPDDRDAIIGRAKAAAIPS